MKQIVFNRTFTISNKEEWKDLCAEMTKFFNKNCYWIPYKYDINKVKMAFATCQEKNDRQLSHLLQLSK